MNHDISYSRRFFLAQTGATFLAATSLNGVLAQEPKKQILRVIAYNVYE
jgi:hypothetical protein